MRLPFSILRSPGSKAWFLRDAERFVRDLRPAIIVEAFAGSAIVGLTLLNRGYAGRLVLAEKDPDLRYFWQVALSDADFTHRATEWTRRLLRMPPDERRGFALRSAKRMQKTDPAFSTLLRSRLGFNGILHNESAPSSREATDRWWPLTIGASLGFLYAARTKIQVLSDAFEALRLTDVPESYAFVDPPYTFGQSAPGHKLYRYGLNDKDYEELVRLLAVWKGSWQLTSEFCPEMIRSLEETRFDPPVQQRMVPMRTVNNRLKMELVVSRRSVVLAESGLHLSSGAGNISNAQR